MEKEEEKKENENDLIEQDKLIFNIIQNRYDREWDRSKTLDGKSHNIIGYVGIIIGLQSAIGTILLKDAPRNNYLFACANIFFVLGLLLLFLSMSYGLKAWNVKLFYFIPDSKYFIENYGKTGKNVVTIYRNVGTEMSNSTVENESINDKKVEFIKKSLILLIFGMVMNFIFLLILVYNIYIDP